MTYETDSTNPTPNPVNTPPTKKKNWLLPIGLLVVLLIVVAVIFLNNGLFTNNAVAVVNGEKISRQEFNARLNQAKDVYAMQGVDTSDAEAMQELEQIVLDEMINQKLLYDNAVKSGITATPEEIDEEYQNIADQLGGEEALRDELANENMTEDELKDNIKQGIVIRKYIEQEMGEAEQEVSEEELNDLYEQYVLFQEQSEQEVAPLDDVREDLEDNIRQQKMQEFVMNLIDELREAGDIEINL